MAVGRHQEDPVDLVLLEEGEDVLALFREPIPRIPAPGFDSLRPGNR